MRLAQQSDDSDQLLEAYHCRWSTAFFRGEVAEALRTVRIGISNYDIVRHRHLGPAYGGHDAGVCALVVHANALQFSGDALGAKAALARMRCARRSVIPILSAMRIRPERLTDEIARFLDEVWRKGDSAVKRPAKAAKRAGTRRTN